MGPFGAGSQYASYSLPGHFVLRVQAQRTIRPSDCNAAGPSSWRFLIGGGIQRHRRAADCMPGGDPADESPGVVAPLSQLGHGRTTDLKSANAINHDRPVSRQLLDPVRQRGRSVHGGTRQHIGASGQVPGQTEIKKYRSAIIVILERGLQFLGRNPRLFLRRCAEGQESSSSPAPSPIARR